MQGTRSWEVGENLVWGTGSAEHPAVPGHAPG